ncbi:YodC family protein [Bradyrhizobium sp. 33ap4]|uniref:YodC family protein n=1 Tax=Bradyrhizobium sp. 33ap4 TaxID=3061630 RepID=UPI00292FC528|nr:DUF2158 domain-containing protein [Bradyrhizobium sp. 33ap4]
MAEEFKAGDVVQLKSGGPRMTVSQVGEDQYGQRKVWCVWFEKTKKYEDTFEPEILMKPGSGIVGISSTRG